MLKKKYKNLFKKKNKSTKIPSGTCVFIDEVGGIALRVFKILGEKDGKVKIDFKNGDSYLVKKKYIRSSRVVIFKTNEGKVIVQNPDKWRDIDLKHYEIKQLTFNQQNFSIQDSRAAIYRWTLPKDVISKLAPLFKLMMVCIAVGVIGWSCLKFSTYVLDVVMSSRTLPCSAVLPKKLVPLGVNATAAFAPLFIKKYK